MEHMDIFFTMDQKMEKKSGQMMIFGTYHYLFSHDPKSVEHGKKEFNMTQSGFNDKESEKK